MTQKEDIRAAIQLVRTDPTAKNIKDLLEKIIKILIDKDII